MKIYFSGSIRAGRADVSFYAEIIRLLKEHGTVLTEHIGDQALTDQGEPGLTEEFIYERDMGWLRAADALVAEVTHPSLGVGYEVAQAEHLNKKVLCLYRPQTERKVSGMIKGNRKMRVHPYQTMEEVRKILAEFFGT